jgi:hypothetical protein
MKSDLRESLLIIAHGNMGEYGKLKRSSTEDFLTKYKLFIDELEHKRATK